MHIAVADAVSQNASQRTFVKVPSVSVEDISYLFGFELVFVNLFDEFGISRNTGKSLLRVVYCYGCHV